MGTALQVKAKFTFSWGLHYASCSSRDHIARSAFNYRGLYKVSVFSGLRGRILHV
jgi:hypothetical protein